MPRQVEEKIFEWTPNLAYAVGLLVTDGNLSSDGRHMAFRSSDIEQIENLKYCLNLKVRIGSPKTKGQFSKKICYRLQFGNIQFYRWLLKIGLFPAKTYTIGVIDIPDVVFRDFLRGHLDGDGSITFYKNKYNMKKNEQYVYDRLVVRFISASRVHMEWLRQKLFSLLGTQGDLFEIKSRDLSKVSIWQLKFMKKESIQLLQWIYYDRDLVCLPRKRSKAEFALSCIQKIQRKKYQRARPMLHESCL